MTTTREWLLQNTGSFTTKFHDNLQEREIKLQLAAYAAGMEEAAAIVAASDCDVAHIPWIIRRASELHTTGKTTYNAL